jgi:COPI associated protein
VFHILAGMTAVAIIAMNFYAFSQLTSYSDYRDIVIRSYAVLFALLIIIIEIDMRFIVRYVKVFDSWFYRGLFYAFIGMITMENSAALVTPQNVVGLALVAIGALYAVLVSS